MRGPGVLASTCWLLLTATTAGAQSVSPPEGEKQITESLSASLSDEQDGELTSWLKAMHKWRQYDARWHNRPARDSMGRVTSRRESPAPPAWLAEYCRTQSGTFDLRLRTTVACRLLADPRAPVESIPTQVQAARIRAEKPPRHSRFLKRVHLDGLWTTTSTTGRFYGLIGSHNSLVDVGRLQVFGPPGVLLLSVPDTDASRRIELGYTWGLSVRLGDVRLFGTKDMTLFVNLSKVWVASGANSAAGRGYDIVGFSLAPRGNR
jgi:hypothetical protein